MDYGVLWAPKPVAKLSRSSEPIVGISLGDVRVSLGERHIGGYLMHALARSLY